MLILLLFCCLPIKPLMLVSVKPIQTPHHGIAKEKAVENGIWFEPPILPNRCHHADHQPKKPAMAGAIGRRTRVRDHKKGKNNQTDMTKLMRNQWPRIL